MEQFINKQGWMQKSLCYLLGKTSVKRHGDYRLVDDIFFIGQGGSPKRAERFCTHCPVRKECFAYATLYKEIGIWAGTTEEMRSLVRDYYLRELTRQALAEKTLETREASEWIPKRQPLQSVG